MTIAKPFAVVEPVGPIDVLKQLGQNPYPGPIIGPFNQLYATAASAPAPAKLDLPGLSAIDQYPYPLAMAWQAVEAESVPFVRLHHSFGAFETLIRLLSTITLCSLAPNTVSMDLRRQLVNLMERPSLGIWLNLLRIRAVGRETINTTRSVNPSPTTCFKIANIICQSVGIVLLSLEFDASSRDAKSSNWRQLLASYRNSYRKIF